MLNHVERFLSGKPYRLDAEGIENMLNEVKKEKGQVVYDLAKVGIHKELDTAFPENLEIYNVTCQFKDTFQLRVHLQDGEKVGFHELPSEEISRITDEIANREKVKIKNRTFVSKDIKEVEIAR